MLPATPVQFTHSTQQHTHSSTATEAGTGSKLVPATQTSRGPASTATSSLAQHAAVGWVQKQGGPATQSVGAVQHARRSTTFSRSLWSRSSWHVDVVGAARGVMTLDSAQAQPPYKIDISKLVPAFSQPALLGLAS